MSATLRKTTASLISTLTPSRKTAARMGVVSVNSNGAVYRVYAAVGWVLSVV